MPTLQMREVKKFASFIVVREGFKHDILASEFLLLKVIILGHWLVFGCMTYISVGSCQGVLVFGFLSRSIQQHVFFCLDSKDLGE